MRASRASGALQTRGLTGARCRSIRRSPGSEVEPRQCLPLAPLVRLFPKAAHDCVYHSNGRDRRQQHRESWCHKASLHLRHCLHNPNRLRIVSVL